MLYAKFQGNGPGGSGIEDVLRFYYIAVILVK